VPGKVEFCTRSVLCSHMLDFGSYGREAHIILPRLEVGGHIFPDLAYADDTTFLFSSEDNITPCLHSFSQAAATLSLRTSWANTKLQNLGPSPSPTSLQIDGNSVESVNSFIYLGSLQQEAQLPQRNSASA